MKIVVEIEGRNIKPFDCAHFLGSAESLTSTGGSYL